MASMSKLYLLAYNLACVSGWLYVLVLIALHYQRGHKHETLYAQIHRPLQIVQTAAILEIVHAITGVYSAVFSRVGILWGVTYLSPGSQTHWAFTLMVVSWALVEVPRYTFYFAALLGTPPAWLTWLRYNLFIILYPTGITGEVLSLWTALPYIRDHHVLSYALPNAHNFAFNYHLVLWAMLLTYIPGSYTMYTHMLWQRSRTAGPPISRAKTA